MKSNELIALVIKAPGKTACEISLAVGESPAAISSSLNRLAKSKRIQRLWRPGQRKCAKAWRYYPIFDVERQEEVVAHLHDFIRNHAKGNHNARNETYGYSFNSTHVGFVLARIMGVFGRGVASIQ